MRKIDAKAIGGMGVPSLLLMENAAGAVVSKILEYFPASMLRKGIVVAAGKGNNGGDAIAAARILRSLGFCPRVFVFGEENELSDDAKVQARRYYDHAKITFSGGREFEGAFGRALSSAALVIDGLLGTGARGAVSGDLARAMEMINAFGGATVSVDIPSGLSGDSFEMRSPCVLADLTVTLGTPKPPLVSPECEGAVGKLEVADIGLPAGALASVDAAGEALDMEWASPFFTEREKTSHKGTQGHLLVLAGSAGKSGAAALAALGGLRAGAGLVTAAVPEGCLLSVTAAIPEAMTLPLPQTGGGCVSEKAFDKVSDFLGEADAIAIGPGLGTDPETAALVRKLYRRVSKPMVLDADGMNSFKGFEAELGSHEGPRVLTPHPGELGRLLELAPKDVLLQRYSIVKQKAREWEASLLVKGYRSFMACADGRWRINLSGGPHMAAPGTGDVLTGIVGSLLARGSEPFDALSLAVFWHGAAADEAFSKSGYGILASEIAANLPVIESRGRAL